MSNYVLHAKSNEFYWEGNGQLSIKTFSNGNAQYKTSRGFFKVEETRYLLLNEGDYTISIEADKEVESFCLFFKNGFAEEISRTLCDSQNNLLTDPLKETGSIAFFEKTYPYHPMLNFQLHTFKNHLGYIDQDPLWRDEQFHKIMQTILQIHMDTLKEVDSLSALRYSTRDEIYRRINIAHDFIRSFYNKPIKLEDIAQVALLSTNHLLRNYAKIYGKNTSSTYFGITNYESQTIIKDIRIQHD